MSDKNSNGGDLFLIFVFIFIPAAFLLRNLFFRFIKLISHLMKNPMAPKVIWLLVALSILLTIYWIFKKWNTHVENLADSIKEFENSIYFGKTIENEELFLTTDLRTRHTQIIGTTSSGKSESVILPWAIQDIQNRGGLIIVDGKADKSFLDKIYSYAVASGRASEFRLFSLSNPKQSCSFNPLAVGTVQEVAERVFSSFQIENEYFESVQFRMFRDVIALIKEQDIVPTFSHIQLLLTSKETLGKWIEASRNEGLKENLSNFNNLPLRERDEKVSGLIAKLSHFCADEVSPLFNSREPHIDLGQALKYNWICYFQLPTMYYQFLGAASGKLVLQCLQNAVAKRHNDGGKSASFVSVYLDDFQDYI